jgi:peptidyl-prolyl cis-trans isomerase SurA
VTPPVARGKTPSLGPVKRIAHPLRALCASLIFALAPARSRAEVVDRIVAVVEEEAIFSSEVERRLRPIERQLSAIPDARARADRRAEVYQETLERMIDDALIRRAANRLSVNVTPADVDRMIQGMAQQRQVTAQQIYDAVEAEGVTRAEYRAMMEGEVLRLRVMNLRVRGRVSVTPSDIQAEYRRRVRLSEARAPFRAAHLFLAFPENPTSAQVEATRVRASLALARVQRGEDFAQVVRELSEDESTRAAGGDLGLIDPDATDAPAPEWLVNAVRSLSAGQVSAVTRGENGFHLFRLLSREAPETPALADVRDDLYNELLNREMARQQRAYLRELRQRAAVDVRR